MPKPLDWSVNRPKSRPLTPDEKARQIRDAQIVVANAVRWASNIVTEVVGNYGRFMTDEQRRALKDATAALGRFQLAAPPPEGVEP